MQESGTSNFTPTFDGNNHMQGWSYDAAGNLLNDGAHTYTYDAECRIKTVDGTAATYTYGPDGERVRKDTSAGSTEYIYFGGSVIAELNPASGAWTDYIFAGGSRIAKDTSTNASGAQYYQGDHLGTTSMMTDATGAVISSCSYAPFGEQVACSPDNTSNHYRFTGKERDAESGLDYFGARYDSSAMGRFLTPDYSELDPFPVPSADFENPQSLNLYSYVHDSPLVNVDPDGHDCVVQTRTSDKTEQVSVSSGTCNGVKVGDGQSATYVPGTVNSVQAGQDGRSIDIGYTPYSGDASAAVQNANAAPVPDRPGLAYGYNAEGYRTLANASMTVDKIAEATALVAGTGAAAIAGTELAAATAAARSNIIFRLAHGMRVATGHSMVQTGQAAVKNAIATAIASGAFQKVGNSFQGVVNVAGTYIKFTGGWNPAGQMIVQNVMGKALQK